MFARFRSLLMLISAFSAVSVGESAFGQSLEPKRPFQEIPPFVKVGPDGGDPLPYGQSISRPLQTTPNEGEIRQDKQVKQERQEKQEKQEPSGIRGNPENKGEPVFDEVTTPATDTLRDCEVRRLGQSWTTFEYLLLYPKAGSLPPLLSYSDPAGVSGSRVLIGGSSQESAAASGLRLTMGTAVNQSQTAGLEATYFLLGARTSTSGFATADSTLGRPFVNAANGSPMLFPVASPCNPGSVIVATTSPRLTGWGLTFVGNLYSDSELRVITSAGYRFMTMSEGVSIDQYSLKAGMPEMDMIHDEFGARTKFHGISLGLSTDWARGPVFVEVSGKIGLGESSSTLTTSGGEVAVKPGSPFPGYQLTPWGFLTQPSNSGIFKSSAFAVLPETSVKIGWRFQDHTKLYLGYDFLYLSSLLRPGDQIDTVIDPAHPLTSLRPQPTLTRSDFWAQGLMFGLELRY